MAARNTRSRAKAQPAADAGTLEADLTPAKSLADFADVSKAADVPADADVEALKAADAEAGRGVVDTDDADEDNVQAAPSDEDVQALKAADESRAAELSKFIDDSAKTDDEVVEEVTKLDVSGATEVDGDNLAVVLFDYYRFKLPENLTHVARKGEVIKVSDKQLKRGVAIGGLREIEG
ncbi:hypothetical protein BARRETLEMON_10 [Arthrobacter phage BarretLemon]|uniref:Uncharacterized protein n=4 Tax=Marthavirus barretlemon TaxID=2560300 RepID=A0A386KPW4_9CAUD|nr:hypothetical protein BJD79_gp10 [Arthrobacter phage BarretLemon]AMM44472.1 hypothetical protein BARRETLEMON_10 [Arthrobacter phage BarretLemon]ASR78040.1 hypothetical protein SEA_TIMINATOR_10 [Arthrobacter phage Timinator]AYD86481.1 hypothetical protein SEA_LEEROYJ_10 [Arthrobacter phage LeeroyJ]QJD53340.1 hypothetical protein SEA_STEVIEBAY_10 [Arthrobacter phage StevieBAY]